jgi:protein ImuA
MWIGRRVFPYPVFLARQHPSWLAASLFVDVRERDARVWAIDVALRSGVATCVVADGQGITLAESRRLQVAAKCGRGVALLARPSHEAAELSAAATRWMVTPRAAHAGDVKTRVAWTLTLVRSKGESHCMDAGSLIAEWRDAQGLVVVPAMVASRADRKAADAAS